MKRPWLAPLVPLYGAGLAVREWRLRNRSEPTRRLRWPVVSIGNLSTGGAGKTPLAIALARLLTSRGFYVDVLSRGYGGSTREASRVRIDGTAAEFGDEPLLVARNTGVPVYVASQRYDAGLLAEGEANSSRRQGDCAGEYFAAHILDDGFQHRQLAREVDILLLSRSDWTDSLLPAGNLREPLGAMRRAHVTAIPGDDLTLEKEIRRAGWQGTIWLLHRRMDVPTVDGVVVAFCGIARPEQFFLGLETAGMQIASKMAFRDHHAYAASDLDRISRVARSCGAAAVITTEKDRVRLGDLAAQLERILPLKVARLEIEIEGSESAVDWVVERLAASVVS